MARHRALPDNGDSGATPLPGAVSPAGAQPPVVGPPSVGDAGDGEPLDGELVDGEPVYRSARVPVRATVGPGAATGGADFEPESDAVEPRFEPVDGGRTPRWVIALLAVAVLLFVGGVLWAVTGPTRNAGNTPAAGAGAGIAIQDGDTGGTGTPVPIPASPAPRTPGSTPSVSASPVAVASSGGVPGAQSSAPAAPVAATAQITIENKWTPNNVQVRVVVSAGTSPVNAWSVHFSCATASGWRLGVFNSWNAGLAGNSGAAADFTNASWNGHIAASTWVDFGFQATWGPADQQPQSAPDCTATVTAT